MAIGIPATIWAASVRRVALPWQSAFQLSSQDNVTSSSPCSAKKPFSLAVAHNLLVDKAYFWVDTKPYAQLLPDCLLAA